METHFYSKRRRQGLIALSITFCMQILIGCAGNNINKVTKKTPEELSTIYLDTGTGALINGDAPRAINNLRLALEYNPKNAIAHNHIGLAYRTMGENQKAKESFLEAIRLDPTYSDAYVNLAGWYYMQNDLDLAAAQYKKALSNLEYRDRYRAFTGLGQIALSQNKLPEGKEYLKQALQDNKEFCLAHLLLGHIYLRENSPAQAQQSFRQSIKGTCASNSDGQFHLAVAYSKLQEYKKARSQFLNVIEQFPNSSVAEVAASELRTLPLEN